MDFGGLVTWHHHQQNNMGRTQVAKNVLRNENTLIYTLPPNHQPAFLPGELEPALLFRRREKKEQRGSLLGAQ
jgi:hypothetical protein